MLISLPMYGGQFRRYNSALDRVEYALSTQGKRVVLAGKGSRSYEREQACLVQASEWLPCVYHRTAKSLRKAVPLRKRRRLPL